MAVKKQKRESKRVKRSFRASLIWVIDNLSKEKMKHADEITPSDSTLIQFLLEGVDNGLDIKVSWDAYSNCYQATAIGAWEGFPSAGYAVSARSNRDSGDALALVWYKVVIVADGNLSSVPTEKEEDEMRG